MPCRIYLAAIVGLGVTLCGCTSPREWVKNGFKVGPNYQRPPAATAERWIDADDPRVLSEPPADSHWWTVFNDPALDWLVHAAYRQNLTLREAGCRILQAQAQRGIAAGNILPQQQQALADYSRNQISGKVANQQLAPQRFYDLWDGGFSLAWELDFWGKFRRAIEAADDQLQASCEDYDAVLVILVADVARSYTQIRIFQCQLAFTRENVRLQQESLKLVQARRDQGVADDLDVSQAAANVAETESLIPPLEVALRQAADRLCTLLGMPAEDLQGKLGPGTIPSAPAEVAVGIPAALLRRRPDVRRAERQLAAQSEQIGIATAQLYPQISLTGTIGLEASQLADLPNAQSIAGSIGPSLRWDILNYGRNLNRIRLADAQFRQQVLSYQNTVLTANQEVEDGLVAFLRSQEHVTSQARAAQALRDGVRLMQDRFDVGVIDLNRLYVIQRDLVQQENQLAQARGNVVLGLIAIYRALGGGWQIRCENGLPGEPASASAPAPRAEGPPAAIAAPAEEVPAPRPE